MASIRDLNGPNFGAGGSDDRVYGRGTGAANASRTFRRER